MSSLDAHIQSELKDIEANELRRGKGLADEYRMSIHQLADMRRIYATAGAFQRLGLAWRAGNRLDLMRTMEHANDIVDGTYHPGEIINLIGDIDDLVPNPVAVDWFDAAIDFVQGFEVLGAITEEVAEPIVILLSVAQAARDLNKVRKAFKQSGLRSLEELAEEFKNPKALMQRIKTVFKSDFEEDATLFNNIKSKVLQFKQLLGKGEALGEEIAETVGDVELIAARAEERLAGEFVNPSFFGEEKSTAQIIEQIGGHKRAGTEIFKEGTGILGELRKDIPKLARRQVSRIGSVKSIVTTAQSKQRIREGHEVPHTRAQRKRMRHIHE